MTYRVHGRVSMHIYHVRNLYVHFLYIDASRNGYLYATPPNIVAAIAITPNTILHTIIMNSRSETNYSMIVYCDTV